MSKVEDFSADMIILKERLQKIMELLDDPHPGLYSWITMLTKRLEELKALL